MRKKHNWWRFWKYWSFELNGGEWRCRRFGQISLESREFQRIDSLCIGHCREYCIGRMLARKLQNYPEPRILSNYIQAIYGMLYDIYFRYFWIRKFFQKNAPYNVCYCSFIEECLLITSLIENWETREILGEIALGETFLVVVVVVNWQD